jgi:hypothetical protein
MKKMIFLAALALQFICTQAQVSEKYTNAMKANIALIDTSFRNPAELLKLSNAFERIALAEKNQWLPYYYAAFCQVNYGFMQKDMSGLDPVVDKSQALLSKADSLMPGNSEISCLKAMNATARMLVNPMERYMQYGNEIESHLNKAKEQDPSNPRPYFLKGQNLKSTPEQFGGGCKTALPELQTAAEKFNTFKPATELSPDWGAARINILLQECK